MPRELTYAVHDVPLDDVFVIGKRRPISSATVDALVESIQRIGLQTPISVRGDDTIPDPETGEELGGYALVAGHHRLEAMRRLGWERVPVVEIDDERDAEMWEIAENLHRAELTALERDEQIARWAELAAQGISDNLSENIERRGRPGIASKAAKELGVNERDVQRAVKVAGLSDEAKQAARDEGLDDNRTALLGAAKKEEPAAQVEAIQSHRQPPKVVDVPDEKSWAEVEEEHKRKLMRAWNDASPGVKQWFREEIIDAPIMDSRFGDRPPFQVVK